jgi:hybrid cluster-associated redox disulfide protein
MKPEFVAWYGQERLPRYRSYPAAPHFSTAIGPDSSRCKVCAGANSVRAIGVTVRDRAETPMPIRFDDLVDEVMSRSPRTIGVFLEYRMRCVGCPIACFHSVDDACREHHVDREAFLEALQACA